VAIPTIVTVKVIAYLRVPKGTEDDDSLYGQRETVRAWARRSGATILATFEDQREEDRPGLRALMRSLSPEIDALVVAHLGALGSDVVLQEVLLERLRRTGIGVISVDTDDQHRLDHASTDAMRQIVRTVLHRRQRVEAILGTEPELVDGPTALVLEIVDDTPAAAAG
jgi:DNA invertase Pin-like site-specific DNA recombinase